jgi:hypothetical protein
MGRPHVDHECADGRAPDHPNRENRAAGHRPRQPDIEPTPALILRSRVPEAFIVVIVISESAGDRFELNPTSPCLAGER